MDDDIRDRFRGVGRTGPRPNSYGRPAPRAQRPVVNRPVENKPLARPPWPHKLAEPQPKADVKPQAPPAPAPKPPKPAKRRKARRKRSKKFLLFMILVLLIAAIGAGAYAWNKKTARENSDRQAQRLPAQVAPEAVAPKPAGTIRLVAVGGSLASDSINDAAKKAEGGYDYLPMMAGLKPFFDKSDVRICNQTTPGGGDVNGLAISGYPTFNAPTAWSSGFADLGCNVVNLASDHINDKGQPAIDGTLTAWDARQNILAVAGANRSPEEQSKIRYFSVKGVKFAFLAYTTSNANKQVSPHGVNVYSDEVANKQVVEARKNAQIVIVSMNWGAENSGDINADQDRIAQHLANQDVDVILGVGSHVLQPAKVLNGKDSHQTLVWFSLGNFLNSELPVENLIGGMAIMDFDIATQNLKDPKLLPLYMHYEWTPQQKAAGNVRARNNFSLMPLDLAAGALAKSLNNTTVEAQTSRATAIITKFAPIKVITSAEF